ncbi:SAM-dependent methyltransferase [Kiloniella sp. b19]|uniref:SAM-dependent methyltransferase n=1 Tax=Kiloniella sp. GXU_MW_B19 TaxID=3141326 RepID=UPI0031D9EC32
MNQVSPWIMEHSALLEPDCRVLDLACGRGRHTRFFLMNGHAVTAVDRDLSGVADLEGYPNLELLEEDLESGRAPSFARQRFGAVVVTNYLFRPLLELLPDLLTEGGFLIYETFMAGQEKHGRPANPDFLLQPQELLGLCAGRLRVRHYQEVENPAGPVLQRVCAVRES